MADTRKNILLAFTALALLSGCDETGDTTNMGWLEWLKPKKEQTAPRVAIMGFPSDFVRETQAGNYLAGQFAQYRQDWTTASQYLDKVMKRDPGNIDLQQRAMILAMQAGDANRAIMLARRVLEADKQNVLALLFVSVDQIARQEYGAAQKSLEKMPKNGIADFIRPILIAWTGAPEKNVDEESLIANGPLHAYHALLIADYMGSVKDPEKYFVHVLTGGGADVHTLEMMGDVYARQGKNELADKIYDTLIAQGNDSPQLAARLPVIEEKRKNPELAAATRMQTPAQGAAEAFYNMARILSSDNSDDSALVFARLSQHLDPSQDDVKMLMARVMVRHEHAQEAIDLFKSIDPKSPEYLAAQRSAAELLEEEDKIPEAIAFLENSYTKSKDINALIQIGDVYRRAERHAEAVKAYDRAMAALGGKVSSDYWHLLYARGMSYERNGNLKKAESDLEAALEFRPDHPYLLNYLGYSWADQNKNLDKSRALIEKAVGLKPDDGYIVDSLGWVYYKMGEYEKAAAELEKAVELVPYDPTINDHLGDAYWQVGRKNEARFQWQRALNHADQNTKKDVIELKISEGMPIEKPNPVMEAKTVHDETVKRP